MAKPVGTKDIIKGKKEGLKPKERAMAKVANQWKNTPQQHLFMENWLTPTSVTFGNAYKSAVAAGYSDYYAQKIASPNTCNKWIGEFVKRLSLTEDHIIAGISELALSKELDSRSPADTNLKAYELLMKASGMIDSKSGTTVNIVQPILGGNSISAQEVKQDTSETVEAEVIGD